MSSRFLYKFRFLFFLAFLFAVLHTSGYASTQPREPITIVSTNDIHASIDNFPQLASLVQNIRYQHKNVLLIDAGDKFSGDPCIDDAPSPGWPIMQLMGELGYNVMVPGNHAFDYGCDQFEAICRQAAHQYPSLHFLSSDMQGRRTLRDLYQPYILFPLGGINIGIIGLTNAESCSREKLGGTSFHMPSDSWIRNFKKNHNVDLLILVSHMGVNKDTEIARHFPEIDLIIGAHTHTALLAPLIENGVVITQTGCNLKYAGVTTISPQGEISNSLTELATYPAKDKHFQTLVDSIKQANNTQREIATAATRLDPPHLAELTCDAMKEATGADIAFYNIRGIRINEIPKGPITAHHIYAAEPFHNTIFLCTMTEEEIRDMILNRLAIDRQRFPLSPRIDLYCSGLSYHITNETPPSITLRLPSGKSPDDTPRSYQVAVSNYLLSTYSIPNKKEARPVKITVRQAIIDYIEGKTVAQDSKPLRSTITYKPD